MTDIATVRELLRRAILTLAVIPDPDLRYRFGLRASWPNFVQEARDAYGAAPPKVRAYHPTPQDQSRLLDVLAWLGWYEREYPMRGLETVKLFTAWCFGVPMWQLQMRCRTNRRQPATSATVRNRMNEMLIAIATRFHDDMLLHVIDEGTEFPYESAIPEQRSDCVESDLRDLPTSPKACISAISEPLSPKDEARAHKLLNKRLERNRLSAMQRKRTKPAAHALMAAVRC